MSKKKASPEAAKKRYLNMMELFKELVAAGEIDRAAAVKFIAFNQSNLDEFEDLARAYNKDIFKAEKDGNKEYAALVKDRRDKMYAFLIKGQEMPRSQKERMDLVEKLSKNLAAYRPGDVSRDVSQL
jgi:hypothetical protein